ncbi:MAG: hypothetical protein ACJA0Q_001622 [Saprospiraceae bacterium]|jgi:uncharacterized protein (DUF697 family)
MSTTTENTKEKSNKKVKDEESIQSEVANSKIIRKHVLMATGVGVLPFPIIDIAGITAINLRMINKLSKNYGDEFNKQTATNVITSLVASLGAQGVATGVFGSLIKAIPFVGSVAGAIAYPGFAGATTYALGKVFEKHYECGGTLVTLNSDSFKDYFKNQYDKGKARVKDVKDAAYGKNEK